MAPELQQEEDYTTGPEAPHKTRVTVVGSGNWGSVAAKLIASNTLRLSSFHGGMRLHDYQQHQVQRVVGTRANLRSQVNYEPPFPIPSSSPSQSPSSLWSHDEDYSIPSRRRPVHNRLEP